MKQSYLMMAGGIICLLVISVFVILIIAPTAVSGTSAPTLTRNQPLPRVNVPNWLTGDSYAMFWFGDVDLANNYADVRLIHDNTQLEVTVHIIDRILYYDTSPSSADLALWDAVTLYLDLDGTGSPTLDESAYRFVAQLNWWEPRDDWQAGYRGNGSTWAPYPLSFSTVSGWQGEGLNDNSNDKGWIGTFYIPFSSLGLSKPPPAGAEWRLAVAVHDRDESGSSMLPDKTWPEAMQFDTPSTWGKMYFGIPGHERPDAAPEGETTIRQGLNGAVLSDGHVGGNFTCGDGLDHWSEWGQANYSGSEQINIQNQWDISDYPCFSKYFVTIPLDAVPSSKVIMSASLTMHLFGNAGGGEWGEAPDSYIQLFTVGGDWSEETLTWNNAPLAKENISGTWVQPIEKSFEWPGIPHYWDVSRAVAEAYLSGEPLRLALYSADGDRHTGKYFSSSDTGDWNAAARPTLNVVWGSRCDSPGITCALNFLPLTFR